MSQQIQVTFREHETTAVAQLQASEAPGASELVWQMLETPFVGCAVHAMYAGPAVLVGIPERHGEPRGGQIPVENETNHPEPGDLLLIPHTPDEDGMSADGAKSVTLAIFYGEGGRPFTPSGWQPGVVVAKVTQGFDQLRDLCRRIRYEGAMEVSLGREELPGTVTEALLYADGASLGNPGPAGAGFVILTGDGRPVAEGSVPLKPTTVNVAEYYALIAGLREAHRLGITKLDARLDSQLVCRQLSGRYRVKARNLQPLYQEVRKLASGFDRFTCVHLPREQNERADALAGAAARRSKERHANEGD